MLREQIEALIEACEHAATCGCRSSRSTPAATPRPAARSRILRFPDQDLPDVVYIEQLTSALYLDKREDVDQYAAAMGRLFIEAEPPARTPEILKEILRDLAAGMTRRRTIQDSVTSWKRGLYRSASRTMSAGVLTWTHPSPMRPDSGAIVGGRR